MQTIVIHVKDDKKINALFGFLNEIDFIDVEKKGEKVKRTLSKKGDMRKLFGIWESRNIALKDIREKAWRQ